MLRWLRERYLLVLGSVYIYNEHRGLTTAIDRVIEAVRARTDDLALVAAISHRVDERKHYMMFRRWFERRGSMPLVMMLPSGISTASSKSFSHAAIDKLDTQAVIGRDELFERLCRVIALTERRGYLVRSKPC